MEDPFIYRLNYGFALARSGYDGEMDYAYQHSFGDIWNDFDDPTFRDHVFAYPTSNGVIDTVQWEGFRQGVDDVRYLSALLKCDRKETAPGFLAANGDEQDPAAIRQLIIDRILNAKPMDAEKPVSTAPGSVPGR